MSDILSKDELKEFAGHPFFHDKIGLLEKLKTRTWELLAMHVPMHSINVHSLRHYIRLIPGGMPESWNLYIKVTSDIINSTNCRTITYTVGAAFTSYEFELGADFDEYFDRRMMEGLKDHAGAIISFSNRESDEVY